MSPRGRTLVAGIGNVFLGDDGFGVEVVRRINPDQVPAGVEIADYGIRGVHLAYDLLDGHVDTLVLVDAVPMDEPAGTLAVLEADLDGTANEDTHLEAHSMSPDVVLAALHGLGGSVRRVLVVGCQPAVIDADMHLSPPVAAAIDEAARMVVELVHRDVAEPVDAHEERAAWTASSF